LLSTAVPVQRYKQVLGAVMVSSSGDDIAKSLFKVRLTIFQAFAFALVITITLSLYLAGTIARPIRRLAAAAERVRRGHGRHPSIPDLTRRRDEIGELSGALRDMTEALWQRMDAIEAFAADVAHEIKNPLTSLRSAVETVSRVTNPEQQRKLMAIIQDDVGRLNRLISDISDASRIDAELSRAEAGPVDMLGMLCALAEVYRDTGASESVGIQIAVASEDPLTVMGIESRLVQILRNLISNALSFSPPDSILTLGAGRTGRWVEISVEDQGPGIPDNKLEAIFDRFYSERPKAEKFGTHSGLGLSISKQIAEAHGGTLRAANQLGPDGSITGARFTLRLPAADIKPTPAAERLPTKK
jgi:two-component system sensor histidine kinase ChvG